MDTGLLRIRGLSKNFGGLAAVSNLDFDIHHDEILGIIGPNGAGKTTVFNLISGAIKPSAGEIVFRGKHINGLKPHQVMRMGISRTFQQNLVFKGFSVLECITAGFYSRARSTFLSVLVDNKRAQLEEEQLQYRAIELMKLFGIDHLKDEPVGGVATGYKRIVGVCMALAGEPELLLLDEPLTGMNPPERMLLMNALQRIREQGLSMMIIEHNVKDIMQVCDKMIVLNFGKKIAEGSPGEIRQNQQVIDAYLGEKGE